jgi:hypothetical protein
VAAQICKRGVFRSHSGLCAGVERRGLPDPGLGADRVRVQLRPASDPARILECRSLTIDMASSISGPWVDLPTERSLASRRQLPTFLVADCLPRDQPGRGISSAAIWAGDQRAGISNQRAGATWAGAMLGCRP